MPKPEAVKQVATAFNSTTTPKETEEITVQAGDFIVACGIMEDNTTSATITISGGSLTWTERQTVSVGENTYLKLWTAAPAAGSSFKVKFTRATGASTLHFGGAVQVWRKSAGIGASNKTNSTGAPSLSLTTEKANSAIAMFSGDWEAKTGAATYRTGAGTFTEKNHVEDGAFYTVYGGYHAEAGAAGAYTVGMTAPTSQKYSIVAIEIKGEEGGKALKQEVADTVKWTDSVSRKVALKRADTFTVTDSVKRVVVLRRKDSVTFTDAVRRAVVLRRADAAKWTDSVRRAITLRRADGVSWTDKVRRAVTLRRADTVSWKDEIVRKLSAIFRPELPSTLRLAVRAVRNYLNSADTQSELDDHDTSLPIDQREAPLELDDAASDTPLSEPSPGLDLGDPGGELNVDA